MNRYKNQQTVYNSSEYYKKILEDKNLKVITHKNVYNFDKLKSNLLLPNVTNILYIWKKTDKLYTVSNAFYKNPDYGWIILFSNSIQSEYEIKEGTPLRIYFPIDTIMKDV